jgi:hypothetical protein
MNTTSIAGLGCFFTTHCANLRVIRRASCTSEAGALYRNDACLSVALSECNDFFSAAQPEQVFKWRSSSRLLAASSSPSASA